MTRHATAGTRIDPRPDPLRLEENARRLRSEHIRYLLQRIGRILRRK